MALDIKPQVGIWTGPAFPFRKGVRGVLDPKTDDEVIATAIQILLKTRIGSWKPDPSFGSYLWLLIFEPLDATTKQLVQYYTVKDITDNIPYVEVLGVEVADDPDAFLVTVKIAYRRQGDVTARPQQTAVVFDRREAA